MGTLNRSKWAIWAGTACLLASAALPSSAHAGASQLVTGRNPAIPLSIPGNGSSGGPIMSPDGRYIVFVSGANDLVPGDNNLMTSDVFMRDRQTGITTLVSTNINGTGGGNGSSYADGISTDGRFILFESDASDLVAGDTNKLNDIFVRDLLLGTTAVASISTNGTPGNAASSKAAMTPDGHYVVFLSLASDLVAGDTNVIQDVFVRDLLSATTTRVSAGATVGTNGSTTVMDTPVITPDGRFVAFISSARDLVGGMTTFPGDVYLRDLQLGTTTWISTNNSPSNFPSSHPVISDDGRYVAFTQKIFGRTNSYVFRYDSVSATSIEINTNGAGVSLTNAISPPSFIDEIHGPEITPDGRFVFYVGASNLISNNVTSATIYQWDSQTLVNTPLTVNTSGVVPSNAISHTPAITPDGRFLAFLSNGTNLVDNSTSNGFHLYLRDLQLGTNYLVDVDTNGIGSRDVTGIQPALSADGNLVAFSSLDAGFVSGDNNAARDVFLRNMTTVTTELISTRDTSVVNQTAGKISWLTQSSMTPDGHFLVFTSKADDLVTNDFNNEQDVFVRNLQTGATTLVSVGTNGVSPLGGASGSPSITPDGRYVAFVTAATNMVGGDNNNAADLYIRDLQTSTTLPGLVLLPAPPTGAGDIVSPVISFDARYVAFLGRTNSPLIASWRDILSNRTVVLTNIPSALPPSMSTNGRYVAFTDNLPRVFVRDMVTSNNIFASPTTMNSFALSPDGARLLYGTTTQLIVTDLAANSNIVFFSTGLGVTVRSPAQWSANGRYIVFASASALVPGDVNASNDVFLCDLQTKSLTRVSDNSSHTGSANGASDTPSVTGDGRFVVFRSYASNIVPGTVNPPNIYVFDRFTGSNTLLATETSPLPNWSSSVGVPSISADGATVAFQSVKARFLPGTLDINRNQDLFATTQVPLSFADGDADGIPDWWLTQYFGHPDGQLGDLSRAQDDPDGDGMSNLQEYLTGTIPTNASSVLSVQITSNITAGNVTLTWPAIPGKSYRLQFKVNADDVSWQDLPASVLVGGSQASITVLATSTSRFYRVVAVN